MKKPLLVVGVGNVYRQDDGVGLFIIEELKRMNLPDVELWGNQRDMMDLLEKWKNRTNVILFDAVYSKVDPGTIYRFELPKETLPSFVFTCSTHSFSVADISEIAMALGEHPERMIVYGIEGECFDHGQQLSDIVKEAAQRAIQRALEDIKILLS
jgi:hydrogenase maturation protease